MIKRIVTISTALVILAALLLTACGSATITSLTEPIVLSTQAATQTAAVTQSNSSQAPEAPPSDSPASVAPAGIAPSGAASVSSNGSMSADQALSTASGAYSVDGKTVTQSGQTYTATYADESGVYVINGGNLTLTNATITTSGNSSSNDNSSFYGLNAGVLSTSGSTISMSDSAISTTGSGANGAFATGTSSSVTLSNVTINATGGGAHGVMATLGGSVTLTNVDINTEGGSSAPIATDRGGGTITTSGGKVTTSGQNSPCLYSTGTLTITGLNCLATGSESAVIEGANSITLTDSILSSGMENKWGVMIYQSMSGDAQGAKGIFSMTGGTLTNSAKTGPLFFVTNSTAYITLKGVNVSAGSGMLVEAGGTNNWGTSGSNGGTVYLTADEQILTGNLVTDDAISSISMTLQNGSSLTGAINSSNTTKAINLTLDVSSSWNVTADSYLTCLSDTGGISGTVVSNIIGNGHTVYYNASACSELGGQTYTLSGGGYLKPSY